jgi:O-antigen ligase
VTFPAGGVYPWVWVPTACAVFALACFFPPRLPAEPRVRATDLALLLIGFAIAVQLVPMPARLANLVDPNAAALRGALWISASGQPHQRFPISVVPLDTAAALALFAAAAVLYWSCRAICADGGAGRIIRAIAVIGLIASVAAIVQRSQNRELLYGIWRPLDPGARPYGPFVNRNHFATWITMACPLVFGYLLARVPSARARSVSERVVRAVTQLGSMRAWLIAAVCVMALAVMISASRSGLIGLSGALVMSMALSAKRRRAGVLRWSILQVGLVVVVGIAFANFDSISARLDESLRARAAGRGRAAVWSDARRIIADFPVTGTGVGTFGTAVAVYQTAEPGYSIGHAHNHYLQLAAEGGALVSLPATIALVMFSVLLVSRLTEDRSSNYLMRAGAAAGMTGALLQSFWETGLRMPANAMLFAVLAAIATSATAPSAASRADVD